MTGTVYKSTGSWYYVKSENNKFFNCRIKGKFRMKGIKSTNPIAVGDVVDFDLDETVDEVNGIITNIHDRKNYIVRKSVNLSKQTHIIASNIDIGFLILTHKVNIQLLLQKCSICLTIFELLILLVSEVSEWLIWKNKKFPTIFLNFLS